eukprot:SAG11_NODE_449_length_9392_cov_16.435381_8_plen_74_part_00
MVAGQATEADPAAEEEKDEELIHHLGARATSRAPLNERLEGLLTTNDVKEGIAAMKHAHAVGLGAQNGERPAT